MSLPLALLALIGGLALLVFGSDVLVRGAARLAYALGLTPFVIGVTVVAFATSAPELFASLVAAINERPGMAIGNVVGSNIANLCLILGVTAIVRPILVDRSVVRREAPLMLGITLVAAGLMADLRVGPIDGIAMLIGLVGYTLYNYFGGKADPEAQARELAHEAELGVDLSKPEPASRLPIDILYIVIGLAMLIGGGQLTVMGAVPLASAIGVPDSVIGLTLVAFGTSLPELAASLRAAIAREPGMAVGNVLGSNVFNLLAVLGISSLVHPLDGDRPVLWDIGAMVGAAVLGVVALSTGRGISRWQGVVLGVVYTAYAVWSFAR